LDLSSWDFDNDGPIDLSGEYEFFWNQLISPQDFLSGNTPKKSGFIIVPGFWHTYKSEKIRPAAEGYATYRLRIVIDPKIEAKSLAIKYLDMGSTFNLFLDGKKLCSVGIVGKARETSIPKYHPGVTEFQVDGSNLDLIIQVSNFHHRRGGAWEKLTLGKVEDLRGMRSKRINYDVFLFGSILVMAFYHLGLFFLRRKEKAPLFFSLFCFLICIRIFTTGERYLMEIFPAINWQLLAKLEYLSYYLSVPVFTQFVHQLFSNRISKKFCNIISITSTVFSTIVILLPVSLFSHTLPAYHVFTLGSLFYALYVLISESLKKRAESIIFLTGFIIIFLAVINDMLKNENIIQTADLIPLGLFLFIFSQAFMQSLRFSRAFSTVDRQREKLLKTEIVLQEAKDGLERRVEERTVEISETNLELRQEIWERKQAQEKMRKAKRVAETANRSKSEFLANMSHELRTPMNHIIGFTEMVLDEHFGKLNHTQEEYLTDVHSSSQHLLSLINDILDLSKVEAGKLEYRPIKVFLSNLLTNSLIMIKEKAVKNGIKISRELDGIPDHVTADERMLKQILYNLLSNAVKFTPDGGHINLAAKCVLDGAMPSQNKRAPSEEYIQISIIDSGIGLKKEDLEMIFQPFEQVENSASRRFQGTGLGLSLSKRFVELHGGKIWAESEGEGLGATFSFSLPLESIR